MFDERALAHLAAPASAGRLPRRMFPRALFFVQHHLFTAAFKTAVPASLKPQAGEDLNEAIDVFRACGVVRPVPRFNGAPPLACVFGGIRYAIIGLRGFIYDFIAFSG